MVDIRIKSVTLHHVKVPLKHPFNTHLQKVKERESILLEVRDADGTIGVGECVAFASPWYTEETVDTAWNTLEKWIIPALLNQSFSHPDHLESALNAIKGNHMAKAAVNHAFWDLYTKKLNKPLWQVIGGIKETIEAGVVVAAATDYEMKEEIDAAVEKGYKRIKIKISQNTNPKDMKSIIAKYPQTLFFADANGAFTESTINQLRAFDDCGFALIEQPFSEQLNRISAEAQKTMKTPFALDESIASYEDALDMIERKSGKILVMKQGRVGGLSAALRIHKQCIQADVPIWVGGMIEFGVSKAFNLAFASLPGVTFPGDFSSSSHFWEDDLAIPLIDICEGSIRLLSSPGVGVEWNQSIVQKFEVRTKLYK
ncbi:o-succinylbenzoate synthase [Paenisporosarcina sp.]|uniref:o-succinylbenzoate synthase n=1 Tax=Paenisporosarcina sp. TaxID=1932001 RepID=UPI003C73E03B